MAMNQFGVGLIFKGTDSVSPVAKFIGKSLLGLRKKADQSMTGMNRALNDDIEQVFLMADVALQPIASRLVKEIAVYGGDIRKFVPPRIAADVVARVAETGLKGQ